MSASVGLTSEKSKIAINLIKNAARTGLAEANAILGQIYEIGGYENQLTGRFVHILKKNQEKAL